MTDDHRDPWGWTMAGDRLGAGFEQGSGRLPDRLGGLEGVGEGLRRVPAWVLWGVGLTLAFAALAITRGPARPARAKTPLPAAYVALASQLADPVRTDTDRSVSRKDLPESIDECRTAVVELGKVRSEDAEIESVAEAARDGFASMGRHLERLAGLPGPPGTGEVFLESAVRGFFFDLPGIYRIYKTAHGRQDAIADELRQVILIYGRLETAMLLLPRIAARYAGPPASGAPPLAVDLDAAWGPCGPDDWIVLANRSGRELRNCTVLVELRNASGESARNLHFIPRWPAGDSAHARYSPGITLLGELAGRRTVRLVESLVVSLWADELSAEGIAYAYAGAERDADVARYCQGMGVAAEYRKGTKSLLWSTHRRVMVRLEGIGWLDHPRITVDFRRGDESKSWYWDVARWDDGESKTLDTGGDLPWDPETFRVVVSFPETNHRHQTTWEVK